jgi:hypothetical protein
MRGADAGITVTLPKPLSSWAKAEDFVYLAEEVAECPLPSGRVAASSKIGRSGALRI